MVRRGGALRFLFLVGLAMVARSTGAGLTALARGEAPCAPAAHPLIAEVFYDAVGDDSGWEFVELYNPHDRVLPLAGARIEAGDGSGPGRWTLRWTGHAGDSVAAGGRFVVGGARVQPAPQSVVTLDLQNGPDAVRAVWPDGAIEVVGYGAQEFAEYSCGAPAVDVAPGQSLARVPDDADLGGNALDFRAAAPSPGRANRPGRDLALVAGSLTLAPEQPAPGEAARVSGRIANAGAEAVAAGDAILTARATSDAESLPLFTRATGTALAAGDTAAFEEQVALGAGKWRLRLAVALPGDEAPGNDADSLPVRAGPGPLEPTEIQFHPARAEGEWIEVRNRSRGPLDLAAFTLSDRGSGRGVPAAGDALAPESLAVLAQDPAALLASFPALDPTRVRQVKPWSSLNNSDDSSGVADLVVLRESDGTPCARVAYSAAGVPAGATLEWRDGGWWPSTTARGTPLAPPTPPAAIGRRLECGPRRLSAAATARLAWDLPWPRARISLELYDLSGRRVARPIEEFLAPPRGERSWSAAGIAPGVYVALARARPTGAGDPIVQPSAVRIEGRAP